MVLAGASEGLGARLPLLWGDGIFEYPITMESASGSHQNWIGERHFATETLHVCPGCSDITVRFARSTIDIEPVALDVVDVFLRAVVVALIGGAGVVDPGEGVPVDREGVLFRFIIGPEKQVLVILATLDVDAAPALG